MTTPPQSLDCPAQLLFGVIAAIENEVERLLIRRSGGTWAFPLMDVVPGGIDLAPHVDSILEDLFRESAEARSAFVGASFAPPEIRRLVGPDLISVDLAGERVACQPVFVRIDVGTRFDMNSDSFAWVRKSDLLSDKLDLVSDQPHLLDLLHADWVSPLYGLRVLNCVDVIVFRECETGPEFLLLERKGTNEAQSGWEYPKGGMELHERPDEAAARELLEETGTASIGYFIFGGDLGTQTADVSWRMRSDYDTLRVTGLTYLYVGAEDAIVPARQEGLVAAKWVSLAEASSMLWIGEYGAEFLRRWDEMKSSILHSISRPRSVVYQVTEKCNVGCGFCHRRKEEEATPEPEVMKDVVQCLSRRGMRRLTFTGGEPLLVGKPELFDLIERAHAHGIHTCLSTTGLGLTEIDVLRLDECLDQLLLSLHAVNPAVGSLMYRHPAMAGRIQDSVENVLRFTRDLGIIVEVCTVATKHNLQHVPEVGRWLQAHSDRVLWRVDQYYANGPQAEDDVREFSISGQQFADLAAHLLADASTVASLRLNSAESREGAPDFMITPQGNLVASDSSKYTLAGDRSQLMTAEFKNRVPWDAYLKYCRDWERPKPTEIGVNVPIADALGDYSSYLEVTLERLADVGIDVDGLEMDHIAYRAISSQTYEDAKRRLSPYARLVSEASIRNRLIGLMVLNEPLAYRSFRIPVVEVIAPKPGDTYPEGLEHVEFVVPGPLQALVDSHPNVAFQTEAMNRTNNPELKLKLDGARVKFHLCTVLEASQKQAESGEL